MYIQPPPHSASCKMCSFLYNHVGTLVNAWLVEENHRQCKASPTLRTTYRRKNTTFPRSWDGMATQVASSALPLGHLNARRMPRTHFQMKGAVPPWWCCHTQQASARTSGGVQKLRHEGHLQVRTVRWRTLYQWRIGPRLCNCKCGKVYFGETRIRLETRLREHQEACRKEALEKSAVAEHAWKDQHPH